MSDKRYPTRMHELLTKPGELPLQTGEIFTINEDDYGFYHMLDCEGQIIFADQEDAKEYRITADMVTSAINHGITRRPRLTEDQVRHLKGLYLLGFRWIERDEHDALVAWENYDDKADVFQNDFLPLSYRSYQVLIVVPTRNAPLNIVQTLRDAGVEVEE